MRHGALQGIVPTLFATLATTLALGFGSANAVAEETPATEAVPGEAILVFDDSADAERVLASAERSDALSAEVVADDMAGKTILVVDYGRESQAASLIGAAEALPGVEAQPNYIYELLDDAEDATSASSGTASPGSAVRALAGTAGPDDPRLADQYYLQPLGDGKGLSGANVVAAWDLVKTVPDRSPVTVAVLDSGLDASHEDLQDAVRLDLAYDIHDDTTKMTDGFGHGTLVSGIIAADADNGLGIAGVATGADAAGSSPVVRVLPVKIFGNENRTDSSYFLKALKYLDDLVESGKLSDLRVLNVSAGYRASKSDETDEALRTVFEHFAEDHGVLCVGAGGNEHRTTPMYPSDYEVCLGVAALDEHGANAEFSDYNLAKDVSAPGTDILSTGRLYGQAKSNSYSEVKGTSFAAPIASAVAALMYSVDPDLTPAEAISIIRGTAAELPDPLKVDRGDAMGSAGALDAAAAIARTIELGGIEPSEPEPVEPEPVEPEPEPVEPEPAEPSETVAVYRLSNPETGEHLITADPNEYDVLANRFNWIQEGVAFRLPTESTVPIYRLRSAENGYHFYTTSLNEYDYLGSHGWIQEEVAFYGASADAGAVPIYRLFKPDMPAGLGHLWTSDRHEYDVLGTAHHWNREDIAWYALPA